MDELSVIYVVIKDEFIFDWAYTKEVAELMAHDAGPSAEVVEFVEKRKV